MFPSLVFFSVILFSSDSKMKITNEKNNSESKNRTKFSFV